MNKVQKIRKEVARIQLYTQSEVLKQVLYYIDELQEEPVSEELVKCTRKIILEGANFNKSWYANPELAFKAGANWQKEQFEKERLKHCDALTAEQAQIESDFVVNHLKSITAHQHLLMLLSIV